MSDDSVKVHLHINTLTILRLHTRRPARLRVEMRVQFV